jgi:Fe-S cluster assembly protein SufD
MNTLQELRQENLKKYQAVNQEKLDENYPLNKISNLLLAAKDPNKATNKINWSYTPSSEFHDLFLNGNEVIYSTIHGVQIKSLESAWEELKSDDSADALSYLHHSLVKFGVVIEIEKNTKLNKPLRIIFGPETSALTTFTVIIKAGQHSELVLLEEAIDKNHGMSLLTETHIFAAAESRVEHVKLGQGSMGSFLHQSTKVQLKKSAQYHNFIFNLPGCYSRQNLTVNLTETGSHAESFNLYLTGDKEFSDISTVINHQIHDTTSQQLTKGILGGDSKGIFTGKIHILPKAQKVQSGQLTKNLILSKKAQAFSRPQLEIFADDVKCSHGSTTGQMSAEELFYFEARGIPESKAKNMLAFGFGHEIVFKISNSLVKNKIQSIIQNALTSTIHLGELK